MISLAGGGEVLDEEVIEEVTDINQTPLPMGIGVWMESDLLSKDQKNDIYKNIDIPVNSVGIELTPTERRIAEVERDDDSVGFAFGGLSSIAELLKEDEKQNKARESRIIKALRAASPKNKKRSGKAAATAKRNFFQKLREVELKRAKESGGLEYLTGSSLGEVPDEERWNTKMAQLPQVKGWDRYSRGSPYKKMPNRAGEHLKGLPDYSTRYLPQAASGGLMSLSNGGPIRFQNEEEGGAVPPVIEEVPEMTAAERMMASGQAGNRQHVPNYKTIEQATSPTEPEPEPVVLTEPVEVEPPPPPPPPPVDPLKNLKTLEAHLYGDGMGRRGAAEEQTGFDMEKAMPWFAMAARLQTPGQSTGEAVTAAISDYTSLTNAAREAARDDRKEEAAALTARAHALYYYATAIDEMSPSGTGPTLNQITGSYKDQIDIVEFEINQIHKNIKIAQDDTDLIWLDELKLKLADKYRERATIKLAAGIAREKYGLPNIDYRPPRPDFTQPPTE